MLDKFTVGIAMIVISTGLLAISINDYISGIAVATLVFGGYLVFTD